MCDRFGNAWRAAARYSYARSHERARDDDACPGALQVHQAADGALARIRLPGGMISPRTADGAGRWPPAIRLPRNGTHVARQHPDPRRSPTPQALADAVAAAGLLPSATHERVRNIVASPLSGRRGGLGDVRALVGDLDAAIQASPALAELPGRFWFSLDDGRGDVSGLERRRRRAPARCRRARTAGGRCRHRRAHAVDDVVATLVGVATTFLDVRGKCLADQPNSPTSAHCSPV